MTPEEKSLLERTYKMTEENNAILHSLRRSARLSTIFKIIYWAVIIFVSIGAYYAIQPYMNLMLSSLGSLGGMTSNLDKANAAAQSLKSLLK